MSDIKLITLIEYIKLHIISLEQDLEDDIYSESDNIKGQISACNLILSTANGILDNNNL
mgnify:CR=1 FL=1